MSQDIVQRLVLDTTDFVNPLQTVGKSLKDTEKAFNEFEKDATDATKKVGDSVVKNSKGVNDALKGQAKEIQKNREEFNKSVGSFKLFGVSINDVKDKLNSYITTLKGGSSTLASFGELTMTQKRGIVDLSNALGGGRGAFVALAKGVNIFKTALIATGVGALVIALGGLVSFLTSSQEGMNKVKIATAGLSAGFSIVKDRVNDVGKAIFDSFKDGTVIKDFGNLIKDNIENRFESVKNIVTGQAFTNGFKGIFANLTAIVTGVNQLSVTKFVDDVGKAVDEGVKLAGVEIALVKTRRELGVATANARAEIAKYKFLAEDTNQTFAVRIDSAKKAFDLESSLLIRNSKLKEQELDLIRAKNAIADNTDKDYQAEADAEIALAQVRAESQEKQIELNNKINSITKEQIAFIKGQRDALSGLSKELNDAANNAELLTQDEARAQILKQQLEILEAQRKEILSLGSALGINVEKEVGIINKLIQIANTEAKKVEPITILPKGVNDDVQKLKDKIQELKTVGIDFNIDNSSVVQELEKVLKKAGELRSNKPIEVDMKLIPIVDATETNRSFREVLDDLEGSILDFFESEEFNAGFEAFNALGEAVNIYTSLYTEGVNRQIEANDLLLDSINERKSELEKELEYELGLQEEGLANNAELRQKEYDQLLADEKKYTEEQERLKAEANKKQLIAETINQTASLITSSINIIKGFSNIPIFGLPLGIAAVGSLLAFFAKSKADAFKATKLYTGADRINDYFGVIDPRGDTDKGNAQGYSVVRNRDGQNTGVTISAREMLLPEDITIKYKDVLEGMKNGIDYVPKNSFKTSSTSVQPVIIQQKEGNKLAAVPFQVGGKQGVVYVDLAKVRAGDVQYFT